MLKPAYKQSIREQEAGEWGEDGGGEKKLEELQEEEEQEEEEEKKGKEEEEETLFVLSLLLSLGSTERYFLFFVFSKFSILPSYITSTKNKREVLFFVLFIAANRALHTFPILLA